MLAPGCQSVSSRTKLFHSGPSITTMTGLVVVKAKDLALLGSNCQLPGFPTALDSRRRTAVGISEKRWETTTWTLKNESHCILFWQPVWYSSSSGNWTTILTGSPVLSLCYQQVSFPPNSTSQQEHLFTLFLWFFWWDLSIHGVCCCFPDGLCVQPITTVNTSDHGPPCC